MVKRFEILKEREQGTPALLYPDASSRKGDAAPAGLHLVEPATRLRIAETFTSRQGEGRLTGIPSFFVRTSGCNLRCWFCDTPYASWNPEGERFSIDSLVEQAVNARLPASTETDSQAALHGDSASVHTTTSPVRHVVLTGGEPLIAAGFSELATALRDAGMHVTVETAGTVDVEFPSDLLSLSPKLRASTPDAAQHPKWSQLHERRRMPVHTMRNLISRSPAVQVKFVVDSADEFDEILRVVDDLQVPANDVWIMPQGITVEQLDAAADWLTPWAEQNGFQYCDRMQIRWYGNRRGT
ncbi:7-carboxy-7-deazaguanine synthase QueE [Aporhodopirellula aestuarii]|uniref:7-carboxy-7-deazaguanine synthase QueE n=1 Tax=Aporhodopirellula aestuarii TaxID=2950107 RepID=UPI003899623C